MDLKERIIKTRDELAEFGYDLTGRGINVPKGFCCIYDFQAEDYKKLGHHVVKRFAQLNGKDVEVTMFTFGDPDVIASLVRTSEHYHKGTGADNSMLNKETR